MSTHVLSRFETPIKAGDVEVALSEFGAETCHTLNFETGAHSNNFEKIYELAVSFFKDKQGSKALVLSYREKVKFVALMKQVRLGPFRQHADVGLLDIIGNDRKQAWKSLGSMSKETAMAEFIRHLVNKCPMFMPFLKAQLTSHTRRYNKFAKGDSNFIKFQDKGSLDAKRGACEVENSPHSVVFPCETDPKSDEGTDLDHNEPGAVERPIRNNKNYDCYHSLENYGMDLMKQELKETFLIQIRPMLKKLVEIQYPGDKSKQKDSLKAMEENQFEQLLNSYCYASSKCSTNLEAQTPEDMPNEWGKSIGMESIDRNAMNFDEGQVVLHGITDINELPMLELPSMWTKSYINEFKDSIKSDAESVLEVGSGEIVTVRIPTHDEGSCLFWEFATDHYDIGFGIFFEWFMERSEDQDGCMLENHELTDDDENDNYVELDSAGFTSQHGNERVYPPIEEVVQISRVDSHCTVQCGSHMYHGPGVYLIKFDNSYSLWRSKIVYYRVYYTA